ncbi:MAG: hypothetical protein ACLQVN_15655 [Bryobacteraceae bacterium]
MSRSAIEEKLETEMAKGITTEVQVIFVMVKIRKLLELDNAAKRYRTVDFYCDWALHSKMGKAGALAVIEEFDRVQDAIAHQDNALEFRLLNDIQELVNAEKFRSELGKLLGEHGLNTDLCANDENWRAFMHEYSLAISDTPLEFTPAPIKHVRRVSIQRSEDFAAGMKSKFVWHVEMLDGVEAIYPFRF